MIIDIDGALEKQLFYVGTKIRPIPRGGENLRRCPRARLSSVTLKHLQDFTTRFGINWYDYLIYDVPGKFRIGHRSGFIIYGKIDYQPDFISYITYGRIETTSGCAGLTNLWILHGVPLQKTSLQETIHTDFGRYEYPYNMWVELVAPFTKRKDAIK
jgi:hypothetical protein